MKKNILEKKDKIREIRQFICLYNTCRCLRVGGEKVVRREPDQQHYQIEHVIPDILVGSGIR